MDAFVLAVAVVYGAELLKRLRGVPWVTVLTPERAGACVVIGAGLSAAWLAGVQDGWLFWKAVAIQLALQQVIYDVAAKRRRVR